MQKTTTLLVIISLVSLAFRQPVPAQWTVPVGSAETTNAKPPPDLRQAVVRNEHEYRQRSAHVDVKQLEKDARQTPKGNGLTGKQKALLVVGIAVVIGAIVFFVVKYGKNCKVSDPPGCTPAVDDNCTCREYEQNL